MKKRISLFLALLTLASAMTACASTPGETSADTTAAPQVTETTAPPETSPLDLLKELDFNGENFRITFPSRMADTSLYDYHICPAEETGDLLNDTSYQCYREVEELLGVDFQYFPQSPQTVVKDITSSLMGGEDAYDYIQIHSAWENFLSLIQAGALHNLKDIPHMNLDASYYYTTVNDQFSINDKLYFGFTNFLNNANMPLHMVFNKDLITSMKMELPYNAIFEGKWTYDKFHTYVNGAYADLNGDGKKDSFDRYGYANSTALSNYLVFGFNTSVVKRSDNGGYVPALQDEHLISAIQRVVNFTTSDPDAFHATNPNPDNAPHLFMRGNSLFSTTGTGLLDLRSIEDFDFGIAPYPKYDENQEQYTGYLALNPFGVPVTVTKLDKIGAVTEALSIISAEKMLPAYLDVYVERKVLRDKESVEVMRMMMESVFVDVSRYYDFAGGAITPVKLLSSIKDPSAIVSTLQSIEAQNTAKAEEFFKVFFEK